eukprot:scaffold199631_cov37-Tisochrysis_lutea.AAC.1
MATVALLTVVACAAYAPGRLVNGGMRSVQTCSMRAGVALACERPSAPSPSLGPEEVVELCLRGLQQPDRRSGLHLNWDFASGMMRTIHRGDFERFVTWSENSPVFGTMLGCDGFTMEMDTLQLLPGTLTRGDMAKLVVDVIPSSPMLKPRKFLWTLQQERRPPLTGCWLVTQVLAIDKALELTI